jgi:hypothetical protein
MPRFHPILLIASLIALSWLMMQAVHEFGHVVAAWATGGTVTKVVLHPLALSRTDVEPNPQPLAVAWGGPLIGIAIPLSIWCIALAARLSTAHLFRFFAGFCLVANGVDLGLGSLGAVGDAGDILRHGGSFWTLIAFGTATAPLGFALWNDQASRFGIGSTAPAVSPSLAWSCAILLAAVILLEWIFCSP